MTEPMITCPKCQTEIKLTESLAAPIVETARRSMSSVWHRKKQDEVEMKWTGKDKGLSERLMGR